MERIEFVFPNNDIQFKNLQSFSEFNDENIIFKSVTSGCLVCKCRLHNISVDVANEFFKTFEFDDTLCNGFPSLEDLNEDDIKNLFKRSSPQIKSLLVRNNQIFVFDIQFHVSQFREFQYSIDRKNMRQSQVLLMCNFLALFARNWFDNRGMHDVQLSSDSNSFHLEQVVQSPNTATIDFKESRFDPATSIFKITNDERKAQIAQTIVNVRVTDEALREKFKTQFLRRPLLTNVSLWEEATEDVGVLRLRMVAYSEDDHSVDLKTRMENGMRALQETVL